MKLTLPLLCAGLVALSSPAMSATNSVSSLGTMAGFCQFSNPQNGTMKMSPDQREVTNDSGDAAGAQAARISVTYLGQPWIIFSGDAPTVPTGATAPHTYYINPIPGNGQGHSDTSVSPGFNGNPGYIGYSSGTQDTIYVYQSMFFAEPITKAGTYKMTTTVTCSDVAPE